MGKRTAAGALLLCTWVLVNCSDDPTGNPDEFDIGVVELRVGTQVARVSVDGEVEGRITLPIGDTIGSVVFLDRAGEGLNFQDDSERNVVVSSGDEAIVSWNRLNKETGFIVARMEGSTFLSITLSHDDHNEFGPRAIPIEVAGQLP